MSTRQSKNYCKFFNSPQGCHYGQNCKFAHTEDGQSESSFRSSNGSSDSAFELRQWQRQLPVGARDRTLGLTQISLFFKKALALVETDAGSRQHVICQLATEGGLSRIDEATAIAASANQPGYPHKDRAFDNCVLPLLQLLSHEHVVSSLLLESPLCTILNVLFGPSGRRALALFGFAAGFLIERSEQTTNVPDTITALSDCLATYSRVVDLNGSALTVEELHPITAKFEQSVESLKGRTDEFALRQAAGYLRRTQRRLGLVEDAEDFNQTTESHPNTNRPVFILQHDLPGSLSETGVRHDNDFEDIARIRIMPTPSEIHSPRQDYLPVIDSHERHLVGADGLLDRQFRLLREDTIGCIKDALKAELARYENPDNTSARDNQGMRTLIYRNATLMNAEFHRDRGLDLTYEFDQPQNVQSMTVDQRKNWWARSRRLQNGGFVCLLDAAGTPIFCSVSDTGLHQEDDLSNDKKVVERSSTNVFEDSEKAYVKLSLVDTDATNINLVLSRYVSVIKKGSEDIFEFPSLLLASFRPTLQALQRRSGQNDLPFAELLAPSQHTMPEISPPAYARRPGFRFDLSCLTKDKPTFLSPNERFDVNELWQNSTLDNAQAQAVVDTLTREVSLIQGPPGTGKSYTGVALIKVLLENQQKAKIGPVLCVCYTNHALDQLLEHLVGEDVDQIVRVGSRSKSEVLQGLNLRVIASTADETKNERMELWRLRKEMKDHLQELNLHLATFRNAQSYRALLTYLTKRHPQHAAEISHEYVQDKDGFRVVTPRRYKLNNFWDLLKHLQLNNSREGREPRPLEVLENESLFNMNRWELWILYQHWIADIRDFLMSEIVAALPKYLETKEKLDKTRQELDLRCLQQARVIGVTTTGLARITDLLGRVRCKVMICEEAGEVLEAHTITALLPTVEHAILIGDHLQLRPQINDYNLQSDNPRGKQYSLDVSLFERLVAPPEGHEDVGALPLSTLETQRRMHTSISRLIRRTLYPLLKDDKVVTEYPEVVGMRKRLFWLDHEHFEAASNAEGDQLLSTSQSNDFEVQMVTALVSHLARQGAYTADQIAVITPYLGQLRKLRLSLSQNFAVTVGDRDVAELQFQGLEADDLEASRVAPVKRKSLLRTVRLATVDNFQGEEAAVVVISLVRSNAEGKVGFLRTSNRINVLLSRAKHGMYIIGNARNASGVPMWEDVITMLKEEGNLGQTLELCCPRHPDTPISVENADDFHRLSPEGGCDLKCVHRLECGHACINKCHSDALHRAVKCLEPCQRSIPGCDTHPCPRECGEKCPPKCTVVIQNIELPCGHIQDIPCHCMIDLSTAPCQHKLSRELECGHTVFIKCCDRDQPLAAKLCTNICGSPLSCGHDCKQTCGDCHKLRSKSKTGEQHGKCQQLCGRSYTTCSHKCKAQCHVEEACLPCDSPCDTKCIHSACERKCCQPCAPCAEQTCASSCPHSSCEMPCGVPCNWVPCSKRCENFLECGHRCPSICGEECPNENFCQVCCSESVKAQEVDFVLGRSYGEVDLDEDPCIFPRCGHILTMSSMDGHFDIAKHYSTADDGTLTGVVASSDAFSSTDLKRCPICRGSLRNICRYGRIVKRALLDESTKRFTLRAERGYIHFMTQTLEVETHLSKESTRFDLKDPLKLCHSRELQRKALGQSSAFRKMFKEPIGLHCQMCDYSMQVAQEEQPYRNVKDMVENLRKRHGIVHDHIPNEISMANPTYSVRAFALILRLELAIFSKAIDIKKVSLQNGPPIDFSTSAELVVNLTDNRNACDRLIKLAKDATMPQQQVEGHVLWAKYAALENSIDGLNYKGEDNQGTALAQPQSDRLGYEGLKEAGGAHLETARDVCAQYPEPTEGQLAQIEATEEMLDSSAFSGLSTEEANQVLRAMSRELSGTGHWYNCVNGHPFTVGECGRPMQQTRCPQCGAPIGGQDHQPVEGVTQAAEIEREVENLHL